MRAPNTKIFSALYLMLGASVFFTGCAALAPFNRYSFDETARLKIESIDLLRSAHEGYGLHALKADSVLAGVNSAFQDASLRSKNQESVGQWVILLDPEQASLARALRQWKESDTLSRAMIRESGKLIAGNFDRISTLEGNKGR